MSLGATVTAAFSHRLAEANDAIATLVREEKSQALETVPSYSAEYKRLAGCCYVLLYAALEFGISRATRVALQSLGSSGVNLCDLVHPVYSVVLDAEFSSATAVTSSKKWKKRLTLLDRQQLTSIVSVNDGIFDLDLQSTTIGVMRQIFDALGITEPVVPNPALSGYVEEIRDKRNAVAHGRESATSIGSGVTAADLRIRYDAVNLIVNHYIVVLDKWLGAKAFVKPSAQHLYP